MVFATIWNEETDAKLRALWAEGLSGSEIGKRLGVSKNSAIGRAHRQGLTKRPSPIVHGGRAAIAALRPAKDTLPPLVSEKPRSKTARLPSLTPDLYAQVADMLRNGLSTMRISREIDVSEHQARKVRDQEGIPRLLQRGPQHGMKRPGTLTSGAGRTWAADDEGCGQALLDLPVPVPARPLVWSVPMAPNVVEFKPPSPRQCTWVDEGARPMTWIRCEHDTKNGSWCAFHRSIVFVQRKECAA
jgi:hypothetical protein